MKALYFFLFGILIIVANACGVPGAEVQNTIIPEITAPGTSTAEPPTPATLTPPTAPKDGQYETDFYSFTIPQGWGLTLSQGEFFDLGLQRNFTIHNDPNAKKSVAFFAIASATLSEGETLESRFAQAYKKGPELENAVMNPFETSTLTGIELTYGRPWGEPRYIFHDLWLENDGTVYVLSAYSYPNTYEEHELAFNAILESFSFKKGRPGVIETPILEVQDFSLPPATARIAFAAKGWTVPKSGEEIFVMNIDGSGVTALSNSPGDDRDPAWSPDGKRLAFTSDRDGNTEVYIMNADGTNQTRLTTSPENEHHPEWSPDGTLIVFSRTMADNSGDLFVTNLDGTATARLTDTPKRNEAYPDWSPNGIEIAFSAFGRGESGIFVIKADGSDTRSIMAGALHYPEWSPDGTQIAFDGEPGGCLFEVYIMNADGSDMRKITTHPGGCGEYNKSPSWSPDGKQLVYSSTHRNTDPGVDIYTINVDGTGETALTHGKTDLHNGGFYPSWSPLP